MLDSERNNTALNLPSTEAVEFHPAGLLIHGKLLMLDSPGVVVAAIHSVVLPSAYAARSNPHSHDSRRGTDVRIQLPTDRSLIDSAHGSASV